MKNIKSHLVFSKQQRHGIFLLLIIIVLLQCIYFFIDAPKQDIIVNKDAIIKFNKEIDSLKLIALEEQVPNIYPFNPNYITDYKGSVLGMSNTEIDRLLAFRKQNKWINSTQQFQEITKVSDSLLSIMSPYFKFPDWVTNSNVKKTSNSRSYNKPKAFEKKHDLNTVTSQQLQKVNGIGKVLSERIIKFRNTFSGGFIADVQLQDVYGLTPETLNKISEDFTVKTPRKIQKININTATVNQLVTIQHIDYDLAYHIREERLLRAGYKSLSELKKVKGFPINKFNIIELYLLIEKEKQ